ncbi:MAG: twin-arginine translocase subunit TatC [Acidobacteria bacterium]|nr:twin-arginine translocase subunit TatC [Acidobacteriota bacterium]
MTALRASPGSPHLADSSGPIEDLDDRSNGDVSEDQELGEGKMSFLEHLDELRKRILIAVGAVFTGFCVALLFIDNIFGFIMRPLQQALPAGGKLIYTEPTEAFILYMKVAALAGLVLAAPIILWQVWLFVAPGLYSHEKKFAIPFVALATFFFVMGALFSHFMVFPWAWKFFAGFSKDYMQFTPKIEPAFSLYTKMLLSFGLVFQMPTIVFFLARMGMITAGFLIRKTKYAILTIFIVAAILTPGPDVVSQTLMAAPMFALYAISIVIAWLFQKRSAI